MVSSWLIHEYQNMSTPPLPPPLPLCPPEPPADPHAQISSYIDNVPVRNSKRKRIKPIEYWNNETAIYDDDGTLRAVEKATACLELTRYNIKTKNQTSVKQLDKENPHTWKTVKDFRLPLENKTNFKSKKECMIEKSTDKKVKSKSGIRSRDKRNKKGSEKSTNKRKLIKEESENKKAESTEVSEIYNEKKSPNKNEAKLKTIPFPSTNPDNGLRRGGRNRIKPIAFWDNEFVQYDDDGNFVGIDYVGVSAKEIEENKNKTRRKSSDENISVISTESLSSGHSSTNLGNLKKNKAKKKLSTTDLATKIIRRKRGRRKKSIHVGLSEYPFNQLNKESSFTLGRILEITDKNGTIRKLSPIKEAEKIIRQAEYLSKENAIRKQDISVIKEKEVVSVNEKGLKSYVQEKASKVLEAQSSPSTDVRRSRRSRIAPVEYWNSQYVQYDIDGTLEGVENWTKNGLKTPLKDSTNDNLKELKKSSPIYEERHKLFSPCLNVLEEVATNDASLSLSRRRLFNPIVSSTKNSRASNSNEDNATATLSVQIRPFRKQDRDQTTSRVLNIIEGISEIPLTPIIEESSKIIDCTKSSAPLPDTTPKSKYTDKVLKKSLVKTWLQKNTFNTMVHEKKSRSYVQKPNGNVENNCISGVSRVEVGESNGIEDDLITDFEAPIENSDGDTEELRLNQTTKKIQSSKDHLGKRLSTSPISTLTPYQVLQKEIEEFHLNASMKSSINNAGDNVKTTISFVPQEVNRLKFNAAWATRDSKKFVSNFEDKSKNVSKERHRKSDNSSEKCTENSLDQDVCNVNSLQLEKNNHRHNHSKTMNKSAHTTDRFDENSPLLKTMQKICNEQNQRSVHVTSQRDAPASKYGKESLPSSSDVSVKPSRIDHNVTIVSDAVTESLESYIENCKDRASQSKSAVTQDKPENSGGESLNTTTGYEMKENHEFYPMMDPITGLEVCHLARSVADNKNGIYTAFIHIKDGRGIKTMEIPDDSVLVVMEGIANLGRKSGKKSTNTPLEPNDVVNLAKGEIISLSYNMRQSKSPLLVWLIVGGTSMEWPELSEGLEEEG